MYIIVFYSLSNSELNTTLLYRSLKRGTIYMSNISCMGSFIGKYYNFLLLFIYVHYEYICISMLFMK